MERVKGIEPYVETSQPIESQSVSEHTESAYTQIRAQIPDLSSPDVGKVVASWPKLSAPLRAAILAIIATTENQRDDEREALS